MKRVLILAVLAALLLCGCGSRNEENRVVSLNQPVFQYDVANDRYDLLFVLCDPEGREVMSSAKVEVRIEDQEGNVLYKGKQKLTEADFADGVRIHKTEHLAARISIPRDHLEPGKSTSGTVFFEVRNGMDFTFKNQRCTAEMCLPIQEITLDCGELPREVSIKDPFWHSVSRYRLDRITWVTEPLTGNMVTISLEGVKVEGSQGTGMDEIRYKITDKKGGERQSGQLYLGQYENGDSFTASIVFNKMEPGGSYILTFPESAE